MKLTSLLLLSFVVLLLQTNVVISSASSASSTSIRRSNNRIPSSPTQRRLLTVYGIISSSQERQYYDGRHVQQKQQLSYRNVEEKDKSFFSNNNNNNNNCIIGMVPIRIRKRSLLFDTISEMEDTNNNNNNHHHHQLSSSNIFRLIKKSATAVRCSNLQRYNRYLMTQCTRKKPKVTDSNNPPSILKLLLIPSKAVAAASATTNNDVLVAKNIPQENGPGDLSYDDLTLFGKLVAGSVEVVFTTALEYISGFVGGYLLGCVTGIPSFVTKSTLSSGIENTNNYIVPKDGSKLPFVLHEFNRRTVRMHTKSFQWATKWGSVSAAFGGSRVLTKVVRGGIEDEWNTIISSMFAGAYFARNEGPQAMLRGAIMYGGLMYLLSGGGGSGALRLRKKQPFEYQEQDVEF